MFQKQISSIKSIFCKQISLHTSIALTWNSHILHKNIVVDNQLTYTTNHIEPTIATFHLEENAITLANIYIAPNTSIEDIIDFIKFILEHTHNKYPIALVGDFKLDMLQNSHRQRKLILFIQNNNFNFHTKNATIYYGSMHDHFSTNPPANSVFVNVINAYWIDHHTICFTIPLLLAWVILLMFMFYNFIISLS